MKLKSNKATFLARHAYRKKILAHKMSVSFYTHEHNFVGVKFIIVITEFRVTREKNFTGLQCRNISYVVDHDRVCSHRFSVSYLFCE
jgi:hypothetical protein